MIKREEASERVRGEREGRCRVGQLFGESRDYKDPVEDSQTSIFKLHSKLALQADERNSFEKTSNQILSESGK